MPNMNTVYPNQDDLLERMVAQRNSVPSRISRALQTLRTGEAPKEDDMLDMMVKLQTYKTGSPEFQLNLAKQKGQVDLEQALLTDRAKIEQARRTFDEAQKGEQGVSSENQPPVEFPQQQTQPTFAPSNNVQPISDQGVPKFIQQTTPGKRKYDEKLGRYITESPEVKMVDNPDYVGKLSGTAGQYSGAKQGMNDVQKILDELGIVRTPEGKYAFSNPIEARQKIFGSKLASFREPRLPLIGGITGGLTEQFVQSGAGENARNLDLWYQTLAENMLRARTGAAAPDPEQVRELSRTFARIQDSPGNIVNRLMESADYLRTSAENIKPGIYSSPTIPPAEKRQVKLGKFTVEY